MDCCTGTCNGCVASVRAPGRNRSTFTFTFMHLADAFIQSDLHCIQVTVFFFFYILSALAFPGNRTHDLGVASAMLYHLSYRKAAVNSNKKSCCIAELVCKVLVWINAPFYQWNAVRSCYAWPPLATLETNYLRFLAKCNVITAL